MANTIGQITGAGRAIQGLAATGQINVGQPEARICDADRFHGDIQAVNERLNRLVERLADKLQRVRVDSQVENSLRPARPSDYQSALFSGFEAQLIGITDSIERLDDILHTLEV